MTDYEIYDVMGMIQIKLAIWVIFLAVLLYAYLMAAHVIGQNLARSQVIILTLLMFWFCKRQPKHTG